MAAVWGPYRRWAVLSPVPYRLPVGWPERATGDLSKSFNCGVGHGSAVGRDFAEAHLTACCSAGISLSGAEEGLAQAIPCCRVLQSAGRSCSAPPREIASFRDNKQFLL